MYTSQSLDKRRIERDRLFSTCTLMQGKMVSFTTFKKIPIVVELHTGTITILDDLENYDSEFCSDYMFSIEDDIFVLELNGKRMMKLNITDRKCSYFDIFCNSKDWNNYAAFAYFEKSIYIFPTYSAGFVQMDLGTGRVKKKKKLHSVMKEKNKNLREEYTDFWRGCQLENKVWLFPRYGSQVIVYDMENDTWTEYILAVEIKECIHVMSYGGYIYILNVEGIIYRWDMINGEVERIADCSSNNNKTGCSFSRIAVTDKGIFLLPAFSEDILYIDLDTKGIKKYDVYPKDYQYYGPQGWSKFYGYCEDGDQYYFAMRSANYILSISKKDGMGKWIKTKLLSYKEYKKVYIHYNKKKIFETECNIDDMLSYIQRDSAERQCGKKFLKGREIWECVK